MVAANVKVYISGPIAGMPDGNMQAFRQAESMLREMLAQPVNPQTLDHEHEGLPCAGDQVPREFTNVSPVAEAAERTHRYGCYMKPDILALLDCDGVVLLPGWENSRGAKVEVAVAEICGIPRCELKDLQRLYDQALDIWHAATRLWPPL